MLSIRLEEQLKQAGYPVPPSLPNMIDNLGFFFYSLERVGPTRWRAQSFVSEPQIGAGRLIGDRAEGISAEDALARLWLIMYANGDVPA